MIERVRLKGDQVLELADELRRLQACPGWKQLESYLRGSEAHATEQIFRDQTNDPLVAYANLHDTRGFVSMIRQLREDIAAVYEQAERASSTDMQVREAAHVNWWRET